jgi:nitronate monooxygenase
MNFPQSSIWQAPTGSIAGPELCVAVAEAGGVGAMGVTWTEPEVAAEWVRQVREKTEGPFQVNFVLAFEPIGLDRVLEAGAPIVTFSWGDPGSLAQRVKEAGALLGIQVVSEAEVRDALKHGPDFLICQGVEAGGHVQSVTPLVELLPRILAVADGLPVVAAGGIATRERVQEVLKVGAAAVMLGTRFVACQESRAHPTYKRLLVDRSETDLTKCFDIGWPNAQHRVLVNSTLDTWQNAGSPDHPNRPGDGEVLATSGQSPICRYEDTAPRCGMEGDIEAMCLYAGTGVSSIQDIPTAAAVIHRIMP